MPDEPLSKSLSRFFVDPAFVDMAAKEARILDLQQIKQIVNVLRHSVGSQVILLDGKGLIVRCAISHMSKREILLDILGELESVAEPSVRVTVAMPLLRGGRFDWAVQKLTELGVFAIQPIICERSVVKDKNEKADRWLAIAREAAEQCERSKVPEIGSPIAFADLVAPLAVSKWSMKVICAERSNTILLSRALRKLQKSKIANQISGAWPMNILMVVGPEGGFTNEEIANADQMGFQLVSLGTRILRSETASVYALAQVMTIFSDEENCCED